MTSSLKPIVFLTLILLTASLTQAQDASPVHIFPQVVDGVSSDGTVYTSRFLITSSGGSSPTCQVSLFGLDPARLATRVNVLVEGSSFETITTRGEDAVDTGYARLDCSQPVVASLTYSVLSAAGAPVGIATVPSAPVVSLALIPMVLNGRYRYGIALANDNEAAQLVVILFDSGPTSLVRTIQVPPKSQYVTFVDEVFNVPAAGLGILRIGAVEAAGPGNFRIMSLLFNQGSFTNVVPTVIR
jgi:hypothetical protein